MAINQYIAAIGMPLLLIFCGAIARKIVRGKNWERSDFYLGVELVLLSLGSALLYLYDLITIQSLTVEQSLVLAVRMRNVSVFLLTSFFLLLWVLSMHQDWQGRTGNSWKQFFWLVIFCNAIGIGLQLLHSNEANARLRAQSVAGMAEAISATGYHVNDRRNAPGAGEARLGVLTG